MAAIRRVTSIALAGTCCWLSACGQSRDFAAAIRHCVGDRQFSNATSATDLSFATRDVENKRVEVQSGAGQMRSGDETDWTFAVPTRQSPRYVIVALKNEILNLPDTRGQDLVSFKTVVRHPERFDAVWLARGAAAKRFLRRSDTCLSNEIPIP